MLPRPYLKWFPHVPSQSGTLSTSCTNYTRESVHDKTKKMACAPSEDSDQLGHPPVYPVYAGRSYE